MSAQESKAEVFDVFLCHNSEDKPAVHEIARKLAGEGIKPWLDVEQIRPGTTWQTALGEQIDSIKSAAVFVGNSGIGPWQNEEIQAFLSQFMERKCPVIPTILGSATTTPELPWTLKNRHHVDFRVFDPNPLKQLIWGITGQKPAAREPLVKGKEEKSAFSQTRLYPPLLKPPDPEQAAQLEILHRRVKEYWVEGVLKHSLYNEVLISLGRRQVDEFVDAPWKYTVEVSDAVNAAPLEDRDISAIYDATGLLLILGEPGSGKTTTLLDLAQTLLERARADIKERVPIVLNLSSWKKHQPLRDWIAVELMQKYRVPVKIGRFWLQKDYLVPLLDGLDEVEVSLQQDCVAAINAFLDESNPLGLLVCCRLTEYQWLPERLKLNGAICLEPLSQDDVDDYLDRAGPKLAALREAVNTDPVFQELTQTPLMLSIMSLTFKGAGSNELAAQKEDLPEKRRKQIFRLYVEKMFQRKGTASLMLPKEKTIGWLSWLAAKIKEHSQSVFLVEGLQPSWLGTKAKWVAYGIVVALSLGLILALGPALTLGVVHGLTGGLTGGLVHGLIYGLIFGLTALAGVGLGCWSESPLKNGLMSGSIAGLFAGLMCEMMGEELQTVVSTGLTLGLISGLIGGLGAGSLSHITLVETMSWKWSRFWKRTILGSIAGLIFGLIVGLIYGVFDALAFRQSGARMGDELIFIPFLGLFFGLIVAPIFGLISGLVGGLTDKVKVGKASPNQGVKLSLKNSLVVFLTIALIFALIFGLVGWLTHRELYFGLTVGPIVGLVVGLTGALNRGGSAVIKHYALRLILWMSRYTPLNFIKFLDHCAKLILLKKVGGGYIFIHRMLLDYFAELTPESVGAGDTTKRLK